MIDESFFQFSSIYRAYLCSDCLLISGLSGGSFFQIVVSYTKSFHCVLKMIGTTYILFLMQTFVGIIKVTWLKSDGFHFMQFLNIKMAFTSGIGFAEPGVFLHCCYYIIIIYLFYNSLFFFLLLYFILLDYYIFLPVHENLPKSGPN